MRNNVLRLSYLSLNNLLKLLFLFTIIFVFNNNILATGDDDNIIPDYSIEAPWPVNSGKNVDDKKGSSANDSEYIMPIGGSGGLLNDGDIKDINNLNLTEADLQDESGFIAKIKSKLPSKELMQKIMKAVAIVGAACVASYLGYKILCSAAETINSAAVFTCKSAVVAVVLALIVKCAYGE